MKKYLFVTTFLLFSFCTAFSQSWINNEITIGAKPDIEVDTNGIVHLGFVFENSTTGYLGYGTLNPSNGSFTEERVKESFVFGPVDLELSSTNTPFLAYVNVSTSDIAAEISTKGPSGWMTSLLNSDGSNGWDISMVLSNDQPLATSIRPGLGSNMGDVEFWTGPMNFTAETVDSELGIINDYGTSIAIQPDGSIGICYSTLKDTTIQYAIKFNGNWSSETVATLASNPSLVYNSIGQPIVGYFESDVDSLGNILNSGTVKVATRVAGIWTIETVDRLEGVEVGEQSGAQELLDLEIDQMGNLHIAYASNKLVKYARKMGPNWSIQVVNDLSSSTNNIGQQASLDIDRNGQAHIAYFVRGAGNAVNIYYANFGTVVANMFELVCPRDTVLSCIVDINTPYNDTAFVTGGTAIITFQDSTIQDCPNDEIIMRTWIATDSITSDTCVQLITIDHGDISDLQLAADSLLFDGMCIADILQVANDSITLTCNAVVDSIITSTISENCDSTVILKTWYINEICLDSLIELNQTIIATNVPLFEIEDTVIVSSGLSDSTGSISFTLDCVADTLSYLWSNGDTSANLSSIPVGIYSLTITSAQGCIDSATFEVSETIFIDSLMLICPADTTIECEFFITPDITGEATIVGYDTLFFSDNRIQDCPQDVIIERSWIAQKDSTRSDTCQQMITYKVDTSTFVISDTLTFDNVCLDDLPELIRQSLDIPCSITIDSIVFSTIKNNCDTIEYMADWQFEVGCVDSVVHGIQAIIVTNPILVEFDQPNIVVDTSGGTASLSLTTLCVRDTITYAWSNGSDSSLVSVAPGNYNLTVTNNAGCIDSFVFTIPAIMMDTVIYNLSCPVDTTISCDSATDPSIIGMATMMGFDTLFFVDAVVDSCGGDHIITRQWIATSDSTQTDTCTQTITVLRDGLSKIDIANSIQTTGTCIAELLDGSFDNFNLSCNIVLDTITADVDTIACDFAALTRSMTFRDECLDSTITILQSVTLSDIPVVKILDEVIVGDVGDSLGSIQLDLLSCDTSISLLWSTGATSSAIDSLKNGSYSLIATNSIGCIDTFEFNVPFIDTTAFFISINDRNNTGFDVDSIRFSRSNGSVINATLTRISRGQYSFTSPQTIISGDQICMDVDDSPGVNLSVLDLVKGQRHILGLAIACDDDRVAGDVNFSGSITGADLAAMQRVILGIDTVFSDNRSYTFIADTVPNAAVRKNGCIQLSAANVTSRAVVVKAIKLGDYICPE